MPEIKLTQVMAFSSEDHNFPAKNLLSSENFKKWKSKSAGEKDVSVMLQFECSTQVEAVHVGNEGSAFVEIFVGKLGADVKDFEVLLPTSSFMSPAESRSGTNPSRVRLFGRDKLSAAALGRPWDCARVVCTQPFCRTAAYGLAFVKFLAPAAPAAAAAQPAAAVAQPAAGDVVRLGSFTLRPESSDEIRAGGLFSRRSQLTAAGGSLTREDRADRVVPPRQPPSATQTSTDEPPLPTGHYQLKPETKQKRPTESKPARPETQPAARRDTAGPASSTAVSNGDTSGARPPATATYRPLDKLLSGVVFAMSGYKNPERATLREQGIRLGAKYRPDWTPDCTHLICAFRNTPKHVQVRGRGKIVLGSWLMACAAQKRRLSWRRHALEPADGRAPDSEDEVWAEELRPRPAAGPATAPSPPPANGDEYGSSTDDMDTDDEIRM
ncbi:DNA repair protein XRCC1-like [Pollicipes pollicipes]|uniref:DNA repair protein XRCC1-like n=1 Tax=Pollicipes pollicipes TaxID=41117 RepID=UPI001885566E|nr:DNA repair protein XRCC1-like [Pollicipes pollicipes]